MNEKVMIFLLTVYCFIYTIIYRLFCPILKEQYLPDDYPSRKDWVFLDRDRVNDEKGGEK